MPYNNAAFQLGNKNTSQHACDYFVWILTCQLISRKKKNIQEFVQFVNPLENGLHLNETKGGMEVKPSGQVLSAELWIYI